jgi:hypothetical protein
MYKDLKILHTGGIRTRDLLFCRRTTKVQKVKRSILCCPDYVHSIKSSKHWCDPLNNGYQTVHWFTVQTSDVFVLLSLKILDFVSAHWWLPMQVYINM